ncbi:MAG: 30S ribosomal protein S13 [Candidatus Falkowbacteria bacterium]
MAVRIAGVTIPNDKQIKVALTYIYGIGDTVATKILAKAKVSEIVRVKDMKEEDVNSIREIIEKGYLTEGDLRREVSANIKRLKEIGSLRGTRHAKNLPVRGQSTKSNNRTVRGNKRLTMGSGRAKTGLKT